MPTAIAEHAALLVRQHGPNALVAAVEQLYARLNDGSPVSNSTELAVLIAVEQLLDSRA